MVEYVSDARQEFVEVQCPAIVGLTACVADVPCPAFQVKTCRIDELEALSTYTTFVPSREGDVEPRTAPLAVLPLETQLTCGAVPQSPVD